MEKEKYISPTIKKRQVAILLNLLQSSTQATGSGTEDEEYEGSFTLKRDEGFNDDTFSNDMW